MATKICFKCNTEKELSEYYKHKKMGDGHLNKCKTCTKKDTKEITDAKISTPEGLELERKRHRDKYHRLDYRKKHKPTPEMKKEAMSKWHQKFPERQKAKSAISKKLKSEKGNLHHWSYNKEHYFDVIDLTVREHNKAHRFLIYDQERMMYRRTDNNELLDTRERHLEWIMWCIENKED